VIPTPEISVIILNWNGKPFLEDCLSAMRRQTFWDFETILVDNGSNDGSVEYVRSQFPEIKLLALPENLGFTGGNIAGYAQASGDLVVLLNNDTEAHRTGWKRSTKLVLHIRMREASHRRLCISTNGAGWRIAGSI